MNTPPPCYDNRQSLSIATKDLRKNGCENLLVIATLAHNEKKLNESFTISLYVSTYIKCHYECNASICIFYKFNRHFRLLTKLVMAGEMLQSIATTPTEGKLKCVGALVEF